MVKQARTRLAASAFVGYLIAATVIVAAVALWVHQVGATGTRGFSVVAVDLGGGLDIRPVKLDTKATRGLTFSQIVSRMDPQPYAAINGTFYDGNLTPLGDILIDGKLVNRGRYPNAIAVRRDGKVEFVRRRGKSFDWRSYKHALAAGPMLVRHGEIRLTPIADGFTQLSLKVTAPRSGVGLTRDGKLLLVVCEEPVSLVEFARTLRAMGAVDAMNLDGGPASGLYRDGKTLVDARLRMTNLLIVRAKPR